MEEKNIENEIIKNNLEKVSQARLNKKEGFFTDSPLSNYNSFCPGLYNSIQDMVQETIAKKGNCKILEIGCGEGNAANQIKQMFGNKISYDALDIIEPKHKNSMNWLNENIDSFKPDSKYDIIFSVNGLIYGYDDIKNYFKFANALNKDGKIFFNFDGWTNAAMIEKKSKFSNFMQDGFLSSLNESKMHSFCQNFSGRHVYYGERENLDDLNQEAVLKRKNELDESRKISYVKRFKEPEIWIASREEIKDGISKSVLESVTDFESKNGKINDNDLDFGLTRDRLPQWLAEDSFWFDYCHLKMPVELNLYIILKDYLIKNGERK